ncbi:MAG: protein tyrosine phosphatase family protein [Gammaproteobacteria bacterium]
MNRLSTVLLGILLNLPPLAAGEEIGLLELFNYQEYSPYLASSGQPTREQLGALREAGIDLVVNLAPVTDPGAYAEEGELVRALGIDYVHLPIDWEHPSEDDLRAFFAVMEQTKGQRVLVHCYANARASAFVYLWRVLKLGDPPEPARRTLVTVWDYNEGYELGNVPHWQQFIRTATARDW